MSSEMKAVQTNETMRAFFAPNGWLARAHPRYEFRPGQLQMAELVDAAFREKRHLLVEAGTGTGKTLAYLLPALLSGRRVVVSTGTKNLQEQLFYKDIPFLEQHLGRELRVCYMKGRNNYLCRERLLELTRQQTLGWVDEPDDLAMVREWAAGTETGDRAELAALRESSPLWPLIDARRETCTGQKCPQFDRCFLTEMHRRALASDLIIVNHHLFFADLALKAALGADVPGIGVIPEYQAVIFDEAHELEDVASQYFGRSASNYRAEDLARDCDFVLRTKQCGGEALFDAVFAMQTRCAALFEALSGPEGRAGFEARAEFRQRHAAVYAAALNALGALEAGLAAIREKTEEAYALARRAAELRRDLQFLLEEANRGFVYWIERRGRGVFLQATPIDVAPLLEGALFDTVETCVLTSATLSVGGSFDFVRHRLGVRYARERCLPSHFDFGSQALLYIAGHLPDPRSPQFPDRAASEVVRILKATQGRAFVLFTSHLQMERVYQRCAPQLPYPLLLQGSAPRTALLDRFRSLPHAVLFATASFWQGVDVPGEQLSCVIIDRLPFAVPGDPVVAARIQLLREAGLDAFHDYQVPEAVLALKQGFGRLIRSRTDRGVLALLDNRILARNYGRIFLESLPDYPVTQDVSEVERFMEQPANVRSQR